MKLIWITKRYWFSKSGFFEKISIKRRKVDWNLLEACGQSESSTWFQERFSRITASRKVRGIIILKVNKTVSSGKAIS